LILIVSFLLIKLILKNLFIALIQDPKFQQNDMIQNVLYNIKLLCNGGNLEKSFNEEKEFDNFSKIIHSSIWSILTKIKSLLIR